GGRAGGRRGADECGWGSERPRAGTADPNTPQQTEAVMRVAVEPSRRAADRAGQLITQDPDAKARRSEALLEMADAQQSAKQYKDAAATYLSVLNEKALPDRLEEGSELRGPVPPPSCEQPERDQSAPD